MNAIELVNPFTPTVYSHFVACDSIESVWWDSNSDGGILMVRVRTTSGDELVVDGARWQNGTPSGEQDRKKAEDWADAVVKSIMTACGWDFEPTRRSLLS